MPLFNEEQEEAVREKYMPVDAFRKAAGILCNIDNYAHLSEYLVTNGFLKYICDLERGNADVQATKEKLRVDAESLDIEMRRLLEEHSDVRELDLLLGRKQELCSGRDRIIKQKIRALLVPGSAEVREFMDLYTKRELISVTFAALYFEDDAYEEKMGLIKEALDLALDRDCVYANLQLSRDMIFIIGRECTGQVSKSVKQSNISDGQERLGSSSVHNIGSRGRFPAGQQYCTKMITLEL